MNGIKTVILKELTLRQQQELLELFAEAEFADVGNGVQWLADAVKNSLLAVGALDEAGHLIGFARALGDGSSDCYIQDVTVKNSFRRRGIGGELVKFLLQELQARNIDWIGLIATPGKAEFYRQLGFEVMTGFTPMRWKNNS